MTTDEFKALKRGDCIRRLGVTWQVMQRPSPAPGGNGNLEVELRTFAQTVNQKRYVRSDDVVWVSKAVRWDPRTGRQAE